MTEENKREKKTDEMTAEGKRETDKEKESKECWKEEKEVEKWRAAAEAQKAEAQRCAEQAARALADYQNLLRRQKEEQGKMVQVARTVIFESLLQPLTHLSLAARNLNDQGLNMVINQFWQTLHEQGLKEVQPIGEKFNPETMEAMEKIGEGEMVKEVMSPGYMLGDQVIQVARVKVG